MTIFSLQFIELYVMNTTIRFGPKIKTPKSRIQNPNPKIQDPESKIEDKKKSTIQRIPNLKVKTPNRPKIPRSNIPTYKKSKHPNSSLHHLSGHSDPGSTKIKSEMRSRYPTGNGKIFPNKMVAPRFPGSLISFGHTQR